ncbi:Major facilitator coppper-regulated transporter crmC [Penicillium maclennaniae]|uniref:Major facilitator coppper-regulated transporter crmC n=1 Tax=Penicillium maclennaniae TaxID=1343394 RepID=UPI0025404C26|nr:Major facilitator coppper-regulated transporter crmC [Penicillium maclennaniae]KAJ5668237.1 Major facilitator coppper-regulated transporter crmC [Penicillium maclennaniae]
MAFHNTDKAENAVGIQTVTLEAQGNADGQSLEQRDVREVLEHPDEVTHHAQAGIQKAEAVALVWSRKALYGTYAWIWLCFFVLSMQSSISNNMIYYAYAEFASAPQISQAYIVSTIVGGVLQLPIAKTLNIWGRTEGFLTFLAVFIIGLIVIASCDGPNGFAAGYTLYWIGYSALNFILSVFVADASGLKNRAFVYAFIGTPTICTAFAGPIIAQEFVIHSTWRWSYGGFAIITFIIFVPLAVVFKFYQRKAEKLGLFTHTSSERTTIQSIVHYIHEFDIVGAFILMAAFILFLLPFSLQTYGFTGYSSATFIAMVVIGLLLFPVFAFWETYWARIPFIRWELFKKRTVLGACILAAIIFFNFYTWDQYFYYYVQVVYNLDTSKTGYMTQIYGVGSTIWAVLFGIWIRKTKYFKNVCLFFGAPLLLLGAALMIHFRGSQSDIGYLVMCQIFIAFGFVFESLLRALPESTKKDYATIYAGGSAAQLAYPLGSETRNAINYAWAYSQKYECITAACLVVLAFPAIAMWKNYNVDRKQVKGTVI